MPRCVNVCFLTSRSIVIVIMIVAIYISGLGNDAWGRKIGSPCFGRGDCLLHDPVPVPRTIDEAKNITARLMLEGIGKMKARLLNTLPTSITMLCFAGSRGLQQADGPCDRPGDI